MSALRLCLCVYLMTLLCGCGSSSSGGSVTPTLNDNWEISALSLTTGTTYSVGGELSTSGSTVTGIMHVLSPCFMFNGNVLYDVPVTGTVSSAGALTLISTAVASQKISMSGQWHAGVISSGTYSISGGCANGDHGTITGFPVSAFNRSYNGTFVSAVVPSIRIGTTVSLSQSSTADSDGIYHVTGTATFTGSPCFSSGTIATSLVVGSYIQVKITTSNGVVNYWGTVTNSNGNTINGQYSITGGTCNGDSGLGIATRS
jgi:hypothetical protein